MAEEKNSRPENGEQQEKELDDMYTPEHDIQVNLFYYNMYYSTFRAIFEEIDEQACLGNIGGTSLEHWIYVARYFLDKSETMFNSIKRILKQEIIAEDQLFEFVA